MEVRVVVWAGARYLYGMVILSAVVPMEVRVVVRPRPVVGNLVMVLSVVLVTQIVRAPRMGAPLNVEMIASAQMIVLVLVDQNVMMKVLVEKRMVMEVSVADKRLISQEPNVDRPDEKSSERA